MWDGWEEKFAGTRVEGARLLSYSRDFNKASVENWGSAKHPGPTLGLVPNADAVVIGVAFEFAEERKAEVLALLQKREGRSFSLATCSIELPDPVREVVAVVPMNSRSSNTYIGNLSLATRAQMAAGAKGTSGSCADYVRNVQQKLLSFGIQDPAVDAFVSAVDAIK
jgi:glutathione-specific gamma-glutamylcyclotransferase